MLIVFHHHRECLAALLLQLFPLLLLLFILALLVNSPQQHPSLIFLLVLGDSRVGVFVCPLYCYDFIAIKGLVSHALLRELGHAPVLEFYERVALVWQYIDVLHFSPQTEVPEQNLVHLSDSVVVVRQLVVAYVDGSGLLREAADALHILPECAKT